MRVFFSGGMRVKQKMPIAIFETTDYAGFKDEEIVAIAKQGNIYAQESLIHKYRKFVKNKTKAYFLIGADREDIIQEGMIGLYKAIRDFDESRLVSFKAFAEMCITRQIITAIKSATRQKHIPLNSYVSLSKPIFEENSERTLMDMLTSEKVTDPETIFVFKEEIDYIEAKVSQSLSKLEWHVLREYLLGKSYQEIANDMNKQIKSIDNALQRVKRKLESLIDTRR